MPTAMVAMSGRPKYLPDWSSGWAAWTMRPTSTPRAMLATRISGAQLRPCIWNVASSAVFRERDMRRLSAGARALVSVEPVSVRLEIAHGDVVRKAVERGFWGEADELGFGDGCVAADGRDQRGERGRGVLDVEGDLRDARARGEREADGA